MGTKERFRHLLLISVCLEHDQRDRRFLFYLDTRCPLVLEGNEVVVHELYVVWHVERSAEEVAGQVYLQQVHTLCGEGYVPSD